jgi:hypothetical protein
LKRFRHTPKGFWVTQKLIEVRYFNQGLHFVVDFLIMLTCTPGTCGLSRYLRALKVPETICPKRVPGTAYLSLKESRVAIQKQGRHPQHAIMTQIAHEVSCAQTACELARLLLCCVAAAAAAASGLPMLYGYMLTQRKKILGAGAAKVKAS